MISDAPVSACYNTGTVTGGEYVGGIAGAPVDPKGEVHYCYNTGTVTNINTNNASAIAPDYDGNDIIDCYAVQNAADINQEILFGQNSWPTSTVGTAWYADPSNDGSENKYWKSIGGWNGGTPTYPTLWWEE